MEEVCCPSALLVCDRESNPAKDEEEPISAKTQNNENMQNKRDRYCGLDVLTLLKFEPKLRFEPDSFLSFLCKNGSRVG